MTSQHGCKQSKMLTEGLEQKGREWKLAGVGVGVRSQARDLLRVTEYDKQATPLPKVLSSNHSETKTTDSVWVCVEEKEIWEQCYGLSVQISRVFHTQAYVEGLNVCTHAYMKKERLGNDSSVFQKPSLRSRRDITSFHFSVLFAKTLLRLAATNMCYYFKDNINNVPRRALLKWTAVLSQRIWKFGILFYLMTGWLFLPRWDTDLKPNYCWTEQILLELVNLHIQCVASHLVMEISCLGEKILSSKNNHVGWVSPVQNERRFENGGAEVANCEDFNRINHGWTLVLEASWILFIGWLSL